MWNGCSTQARTCDSAFSIASAQSRRSLGNALMMLLDRDVPVDIAVLKRPELEDCDVDWNIAIKQHHQSIAQRPAGLGRGNREGAVAGAGLGRAPVPHRQEPVPA